jgi:hypothetical protein
LKISKEAYEAIKFDIEYELDRNDYDEFLISYKFKLNYTKDFFKKDYNNLENFTISKRALEFLHEIVRENNKIHLYKLEDEIKENILIFDIEKK